MAEYLDTLLASGETVTLRARQHWFALIRFALQPILILAGAFLLLAIGMNVDGDFFLGGAFDWLLGLVTLGLFVLAAVWLPIQFIRWTSRRYALTSRRVLYVDGVLRKRTVDAGLDKITDVGFQQGPLGRTMGFGDVAIVTAAGEPLRFRTMVGATEFKKAIMTGQDQIQRDRAGITADAIQQAFAQGAAPAAPAVTTAPHG